MSLIDTQILAKITILQINDESKFSRYEVMAKNDYQKSLHLILMLKDVDELAKT